MGRRIAQAASRYYYLAVTESAADSSIHPCCRGFTTPRLHLCKPSMHRERGRTPLLRARQDPSQRRAAGLRQGLGARTSGRARQTYGNLDAVVVEGKLLPAFAFERGAAFQMPVLFVTKQDQPLPALALEDYTPRTWDGIHPLRTGLHVVTPFCVTPPGTTRAKCSHAAPVV